MKHEGGSIMFCGCFAIKGTGALHAIEHVRIMRWEDYDAMLKQHLKTSARKLKLGHN